MRIALFIDDLKTETEDVQQLYRMISELKTTNDFVIFTRFYDKKEFNGVPVVILNKVLNIHNKEYKMEIKKGFDIIHLSSEQGIHKIAVSLSRKKNIPITYTFHGIDRKGTPWRENLRNIFWTATQTDKLVVPLETLSHVIKDQGFDKEATIIDNSIKLTGWERPEHKVWQEFRESLGVGNTFNILYMGKITDNQSSDMLFQSFLKVYHAIPTARLILIGDSGNRDKYIDFIEANEITNVVVWYNKVSEELLPKYMSLGDISIVTTDREKHKDWILYSMLNKMPVIARESFFVKRLMQFGDDTNLLVFQTPEQLVERITTVYSSGSDFYLGLQKNGLETAQRFSSDLMAKKYLELWTKMIK